MMKLKNWVGLCTLLLSLQAYGNEISIQGAWIRPLTPGLEIAMVGMVIHSPVQARITLVTSSAYTYASMQGPSKSGATKTQELDFIALPAQKSVVLNADSMYLLLSGNKKTIGVADAIPVVVTVQFNDNTRKTITIMAQPEQSKSSAVMPQTEPRNPVEISNKVEAKIITPPTKPLVSAKSPAVEVKSLKAAIVVAPKPAQAPVSVVTPKVAPHIVEQKKTTEVKPAEPPKQSETRVSAECLSLAEELRSCDQSSNDALLAWCETNAKSKYACQLSMEQLKKLRN